METVNATKVPAPKILQVGELVMIHGGRFRVKSFGRKVIVLEAEPGVRIEKTSMEGAKG